MIKRKYKYLAVLIMLLFSYAVFLVSLGLIHLMLIWNMILALIPLLVLRIEGKAQNKYLNMLLLVIWMLFLPNAFYTFTDLIHIQYLQFTELTEVASQTYYNAISNVHVGIQDIMPWIELINIWIISIAGFYIGCVNVKRFVDRFATDKEKVISIGVISFLSGVGIYIGRFLRFNSWNIFNPVELIKTLLESINVFAIQYVVLIGILIFVVSMLYNFKDRLLVSYNKEKDK